MLNAIYFRTSALIDLLKCLKKILSKMRIRSANKFLEYSILLLKIVLDFDKQEIGKNTTFQEISQN